jgi:hypothetical protein
MEVSNMRKSVVRTLVAGTAACLMAGFVMIAGGNDSAKADGAVICDYNFDDGNLGDCYGNSATLEIVEGMNSDYKVNEDDKVSATDGCCVRVSKRTGYWENSTFAYKLDKLEHNKKYTMSYDVYHDNGLAEKYGTKNRVIIAHTMPKYGQIGQPMAVFDGEWERITMDFTLADVAEENEFLYLEFAYPEATNQNENDAYKDKNTETFYIDNFSIKEYVEPTKAPTKEPTATPTAAPTDAAPTAAATSAPTAVPTEAPTPTPFVDTEDEGLDVGYEEAVKGVTYVVTGKDTVKVTGFEDSKTSLVIPDTVVIEEITFKVTEIADKAFSGENIKSLTIGKNITKIGKQAFFKCTSLKKIKINSSVIKTFGAKSFKNTPKKAKVTVPKAKKKAYKKQLVKAGLNKKASVK